MIRITDTTLTHIPSAVDFDHLKIIHFCELLCLVGADYIEMPVSMYEHILKLFSESDSSTGAINQYSPEIIKARLNALPLVLRIELDAQMQSFPEILRFVCRSCDDITDPRLICERQINDIREINRLHNVNSLSRIRIKGLDDVLLKEYTQVFSQLSSYLGKEYEFCPQNSYSVATATAVEWVNLGGTRLATSFGGVGSCAPTEEVLMALRINKRHHPNHDMTVFPELKQLFEEMTGILFDPQKPILGSHIFQVEAGIHADGIEKDPYTYEPYEPGSVGTARALIVGKHSGKKAIEIKLSQLEIPYLSDDPAKILRIVQTESIRLGRSLSDEEFAQIVNDMK
jgi:homocitrate synthase NifV